MAQKKYEKESRISKKEFPTDAENLLQKYLHDAKRIRFYKETDSSKTSYEAKFKKHGKKYSVEFDINGILEDIEVEMNFNELPDKVQETISSYLKQNTKKYTIKKLQKQYYYKKDTDLIYLTEIAFNNGNSDFINYEIVIWRFQEKESGMAELTFNKNGEFLTERPFAQASYDHILY
ncbi:hypothetical protein [Ascidiimonas sp. W6]|uniref:hypothetical protein n=1 Tax=Ascidiimonas meishanensis TaxID=3128903 RepID=UPI0030ECD5C2